MHEKIDRRYRKRGKKNSNAAFGTIQYSKIRWFVRFKNRIETRNTAFT